MRIFISLIFIAFSFSWASILDFKYLDDAKKAYENKDFEKAADSYSKVNSDESKFNEADSLYKAKKYDEALKTYSSISNKELEFNKLYNMGNSYANLKDIEKAIKSYEDALKIKDDEDAKYNLELLKKKKEEQKKNQDNKNKQENKQDNKSDQNKQNEENQQENSQNQNQDKQQNKEDNQKQENQQEPEQKNKNEQEEQKQTPASETPQKEQTISNMEERKWQKLLNDREINTLLLPLTKGDNNEKQPW